MTARNPPPPLSVAHKGAALTAAIAMMMGAALPAAARKTKTPPAVESTPPPPVVVPPPVEPTPVPSLGPDGQPLAPVQPPPPPMMQAPPGYPMALQTRERPFWELSAIGGGIIGGAWVLGALVGAFSYAGYYQGQWGWFVPVAGPFLSMTNVDGGEPNGCLSKAGYTYSLGPILTLITVGGIATAIAGGIAKKRVPVNAASSPIMPMQIAPTVGPSAGGLTFSGRF